MKRFALPAAVAALALAMVPAGANAADFSYTYLEVAADLSRTKNTAAAPIEKDANGVLIGVAGSWEVLDSLYLKGSWSQENKEFANRVSGTALDLDSKQTVLALGAGYHFQPADRTSVYLEALAIVDFKVDHSVPLVTPAQAGPPMVSTTRSEIKGNGFAATLGLRHWIADDVELEGQIARIHTNGKVRRTGAKIRDSETMLRLGGHYHVGSGFSLGAYLSYSKHTDDNFNNIRKLGLLLRYHF